MYRKRAFTMPHCLLESNSIRQYGGHHQVVYLLYPNFLSYRIPDPFFIFPFSHLTIVIFFGFLFSCIFFSQRSSSSFFSARSGAGLKTSRTDLASSAASAIKLCTYLYRLLINTYRFRLTFPVKQI